MALRSFLLTRSKRREAYLQYLRSSHCTPFIVIERRYFSAGNVNSGRPIPINDAPSSSYSSTSRLDFNTTAVSLKQLTDPNDDQMTVSPEVISSMISAALEKKDWETLRLLIAEADRVGKLNSSVLESSINQCISASALECAVGLLRTAKIKGFLIKEPVCQSLISNLVSFCKWGPACDVASYMVHQGYRFKDREVFFIVGGLMRNAVGVSQALELIALITDKRRSDLSGLFSYTKANNFARSMGSVSSRHNNVPVSVVQLAVDSSITALHDGWFSFSMSKMIVALAAAAGHDKLAIDYVRTAVDAVVKDKIQRSDRLDEQVDLLSVLRGFSQGAGVASADASNFVTKGIHEYSPLSAAILDLVVRHADKAGLHDGPLQCMDLMKMYWVLCHRLRMAQTYIETSSTQTRQQSSSTVAGGVASSSSSGSSAMAAAIGETLRATGLTAQVETEAAKGDQSLRLSYDDLRIFLLDDAVEARDFTPAPGYTRRNFRVLCDELGVHHKLVDEGQEQGEGAGVVRVWKPEARITVQPSSLDDILRKDAKRGKNRKFDSEPAYWQNMRAHLQELPRGTLRMVAMSVTMSMRTAYPSACWGLLWLDLLEEQRIPLNRGLLRNVLTMAGGRGDVYALLELLYAARRAEASGVTDSRFSAVVDDSSIAEEEDDLESDRLLRQRDWNRACQAAWHSRVKELPSDSFREAFTEVIRVMRDFGVDLDSNTTRTLLRFLVHTQPSSDLTWKIVRRLYRDKGAALTHIECIAATSLLLRRFPTENKIVSLSMPLYRSENYLVAYPGSLAKMVDTVVRNVDFFGMDFVKKFEGSWKHLHSREGRDGLYSLMLHTVSMRGRRTELIHNASDDTRRAVSLITAYASYLVAAQDESYRRAFDILYAAESLNREADEVEAQAAESSREADGDGEDAGQ